jgi:hypothetical protein
MTDIAAHPNFAEFLLNVATFANPFVQSAVIHLVEKLRKIEQSVPASAASSEVRPISHPVPGVDTRS